MTRVQIALALVLTIISACGLNLGYLLQHQVASSAVCTSTADDDGLGAGDDDRDARPNR